MSTPEQRAKWRAYWHQRYADPNRRERILQRSRNSARYDIPDRPEGQTPREVTLLVRLECLSAGGDPGVASDMTQAALRVGFEFPWLARGYLHPDYLPKLAGNAASHWRDNKQLRDTVLNKYHFSK